MMPVAMLAMVLALAIPAMGQVDDSGNNNEINCAAAQELDAVLINAIDIAIAAGDDVEDIQFLIDQINEVQGIIEQQCGVFLSDDDTINEGDRTVNNEGDTTTITSDQEFEQDFDSGDLEQPTDINVTGDNSAVCTPVQPTGNTGNGGSEQGLQPLGSASDDTDLAGNASDLAPEMTTDCAPSVSQDAANQLV
jgi:hypothetical protein